MFKRNQTDAATKKIELAKRLIRDHLSIFRCPVCGAAFRMNEPNSLVCANGHCFNMAKTGYVDLRPALAKQTAYDREMFESRHAICKSGLFDQMIETMGRLFLDERQHAKRLYVLDAGCGEGSHLANLTKALRAADLEVVGTGIDLAKDGVRIASRDYSGLIWCVADLARSPFADMRFDCILNLFSPANYTEFRRMLRDEGMLLKVVPESDHFIELRTAFHGHTARKTYSNERVIARFGEVFQTFDICRIRYEKKLEPTDLKHLIRMTPLSWGATEENMQKVLRAGVSQVTVDVVALAGKKRIRRLRAASRLTSGSPVYKI